MLIRHIGGMDRNTAIKNIRDHANQIAVHVTAIHPLTPSLSDAPTQAEMMKVLYELTKSVEVVKKLMLKLEKRDDSTVL